jgi:hypothetical protein
MALAGLAILPAAAAIPPAASAVGADAELVRLGKQLEILVDAYYAAQRPWSRALSEAHRVHLAALGDPANRGYQDTPEIRAAFQQTCERLGVDEASDRLSAAHQEIEPIAEVINALPCTSIEGLRAKALVAFWEVAPSGAGDTEFSFDHEYSFQQLFCAVAECCGLNSKITATGFEMPNIEWTDQDDDDDDPDEAEDQPLEMGGAA